VNRLNESFASNSSLCNKARGLITLPHEVSNLGWEKTYQERGMKRRGERNEKPKGFPQTHTKKGKHTKGKGIFLISFNERQSRREGITHSITNGILTKTLKKDNKRGETNKTKLSVLQKCEWNE